MFGPRLASGIVLVVFAFLALFFGDWILATVLCLISVIGYYELTCALKSQKERTDQSRASFSSRFKDNQLEIVGYLGIGGFYSALYFWDSFTPLFVIPIVVLLLQLFVYVIRFPAFHVDRVAKTSFSFFYVPILLSFVYLTREAPGGSRLVWLILIGAWGSDTCAYVVGKLIGKKRIFPVLSPKKSFEGCIGGVVGAALIGGVYAYFEPLYAGQSVVWQVAFICAAASVIGQVGDLAASAMKRDYQIKDYGKLIPGHGGVLDRFDSMLATAPAIYILTILIF
ncbi:MAG: phosphatidate cytidylyltransferase [Lachnospiraceae bacterium]|jgi:phosphatidate cytidylyltransferase|nr:phosphatidate cytidylyltransferase [Lachnospiraceae bacterium]